MRRLLPVAVVSLLLACAVAEPSASAAEPLEEDLAFEAGVEVYLYAFPMVMMEMTRRVGTNV